MIAKTEVARTARLFVLDASGGRILSMNPDGSDRRVIVTGCRLPDGVAIDAEASHVYWTNMGVPNRNDGAIERSDLDGSHRTTIVPEGATFTPKQLHLDRTNRKLYWSDREGMRVMRANLDGSGIETLVDSSRGDARPGPDQTKWCVGITIDAERGHVYWTQKGPDNAEQGRIFRAGIDIPKGERPSDRTDIEVLFDHLPEPIDLELEAGERLLYWTDRGDPPRGNTVNRASVDTAHTQDRAPDILVTHLMEGIGLALDPRTDRMFMTDLAGSIYCARLDGSDKRAFLQAQGNLTGIAYAEIPTER